MTAKAEESQQVARARKKLTKQITSERKKITPQALSKVVRGIKLWITRHSQERASLKDKNIAFFDENQHPAKVASQYVRHLQDQLQSEMHESDTLEPLKGRITKEKK